MLNTKPIQDFIIVNERNMRIAAAVSEAWPEARDQLVADFLDRLRSVLMTTLKGWTIAPYNRFFADKNGNLSLTKPAWKEEYFVELACHDYGEKIFYGVSRAAGKDHIKNRPHFSEVLAAVKKVAPTAIAAVWWEAKIMMHSPAPDWRKSEVLWRLHTDGKFLEDVAKQLLDVAEVSGPIIDRLVPKT